MRFLLPCSILRYELPLKTIFNKGEQQMKKIIYLILSLSVFVSFIFSQEKSETSKYSQDETNAQVPALDNFHKIIVPIWHTYWKKNDIESLKKAIPEIDKYVTDIYKSEMTGILRDKKEKWNIAKDTLKSLVASYKNAAEQNDSVKILKAAELLHRHYEAMLRIVRPKIKELDAFHVILYPIYHYYMPDFKLDSIKAVMPKLVERRDSLMVAKRVFPMSPDRFKKKEMYEKMKKSYDAISEKFYEVRKELSAALDEVLKVLPSGDKEKILKALEEMHTKYQKCESAFE
jgi:hypothetical protein